MTLKISFSDLLRQDLKGRGWMAALSFLGNFLALPVLFLLARQRYLTYAAMGRKGEIDRETLAVFYSRFFTSEANLSEGIILVGGAAIVAVFGFRYLYSRTMVDTYHSLPVSRTRLFFAKYLNGLLLWLIPFLVSMIFTLLLALGTLGTTAYSAAIAAAAVKGFCCFLISFLIVYHLFLLAVMISGSLFSAVMSAVIMGTAAAGAYELICHLLRATARTYLTRPVPENYIVWLSPLWSVVRILGELGDPTKSTRSFTAPSENAGIFFLLAASLLLAAWNLLAAWKMYLLRPSELAEHGIENKPLRNLLTPLGTYTAGLLGACLFLDLLRAALLPGKSSIYLGWCLFAAIVSCLLAFGVLNMIFHMELRAFFRNFPLMGAVTGFTVLTILCIALDWTSYDTRLPRRDRVASAAVEFADYNDSTRYLVQNSEGKLEEIPPSLDHYGMEYTDMDTLWEMLSSLTGSGEADDSEILSTVEVRLRLNGGGSFYRNYPIYQKDLEAVRPVLESEEYLNTHYRLSSGQFLTPQALDIRDENRGISYSVTDPEQIARIMDAYYQDFREHSTLEELHCGVIVATIQTLLRTEESSRYYPLYVYDYDTAVIQALKEQETPMATLPEDLDLANVKLSFTLNDGLSREALYSYFQLDGYPSYRTLLKEAGSREAYAEVGSSPIVRSEDQQYEALITASDELKELLPYLHIGSYWGNGDLNPERYVTAGQITDTSGHIYTCYVKAGMLPAKWIDAMVLVR